MRAIGMLGLLLAGAASVQAQVLPEVAPSPAPAPPGPAGTWVPAELRRALQAGRKTPLPCWIELAPDRTAASVCAAATDPWGGSIPVPKRPGATTLVFPGPPPREVVFRAGIPEELEVIERLPDGEVFRRLYRLPPELAPRLAAWRTADRLLAGRHRTAEGAALVFEADGTYRFENETGRFRVELEPPVPGTLGRLVLEPEDAAERAYFLVARGGGVGLAPVPADFPPELPEQPDLPAWAPAGAESGAAVDLGLPEEARPAAPPPVWTGPLPEVTIALLPEAPAAPEPPSPPPPPDPGAPPPIARPIEPASRCGCTAADAGPLGLLAIAWRRKQHPRR